MTFLPYIRRIYIGLVWMTSGFESIGPLAHRADALYAVRVPRTGSLPTASFGFRLAADTLAVRLGVPVIRASAGTRTRPVNTRLAFAHRLQRQVMTLRVMPDAPRKQKPSRMGLGFAYDDVTRRLEAADFVNRSQHGLGLFNSASDTDELQTRGNGT